MEERREETARPIVYQLDVPQKNRTPEAVILIITLALLFVFAYVFIGHPGPMRHPPEVDHARHSINR